MVEASHVAQQAMPSLKQHRVSVIFDPPVNTHAPVDVLMEYYFDIVRSFPERELLKIFLIWK
ncbi:hypothetical protein T03_4979 [Trichinella britovi]|uniref:Uncharacterized protein n=1 Tax=Trichinella britovi TaxID=45882 RepID=A0A0V1AMN3_TRIBR|nr:hypothetical protein T03_4979 [Trichinella britovi]